MGKENQAQSKPFVIIAIDFVNFESPLSIATRLSNPANMIAIPAPANQRV